MTDITKCYGGLCPIKETCRRFKQKSDELHQSYFSDFPGVFKDGKFTCDMYWDEAQQNIFDQLRGIVGGKFT
jgi:hypothetical protein